MPIIIFPPYSAPLINASSDPFFANVSLLMHFDGTNGGSSFVDVKGATVTNVGSTTTSTTQVKYGTTAGVFGGSSYLTVPDNTNTHFGSGDFTIEGWIYMSNLSNTYNFFVSRNDSSGSAAGSDFDIYVHSNGSVNFEAYSGSTQFLALSTGAGSVVTGQWYHIACVRFGSNFTTYINGVAKGTTTNASALNGNAIPTYIGNESSGFSRQFNGYIDDLRITKGVARYTSNFAVPTAAFPDNIPGTNWTARDSSRNWYGLASSADGVKLVAAVYGGQIYTSTDSGATWTARDSSRNWITCASSSDGTKLVAGVYGGQIYTSTDSGATWTARDSSRNWRGITSSTDGVKLAAVNFGGQIYTSTDSGATWTARESARNWWAIASSSDGAKLVAANIGGASNGFLYTSTDSGVTWTQRATAQNWHGVASSYDGTKLVGVAATGQIYTSTDSGVTWTARDSSRNWYGVTSSSDGMRLAAVVYNSSAQLYTSLDSGVTWNTSGPTANWFSCASSADGAKLVAGTEGGSVYTNS